MTTQKNSIANGTENAIAQTSEVVKTRKPRTKKAIIIEAAPEVVEATTENIEVVAEVVAEVVETKKKRKSEKRKLFLIEGILYNVSTKKLAAAKLVFKTDEVALTNWILENSKIEKFTKTLFLVENVLYNISNTKLAAAKLIFKTDEDAIQKYVLENSKVVKFSEKF